jgi:methionine aminopeptidase
MAGCELAHESGHGEVRTNTAHGIGRIVADAAISIPTGFQKPASRRFNRISVFAFKPAARVGLPPFKTSLLGW